MAAVLIGSAAFASPAGAAVANVSHIIEVVSNTSDVLIGGVNDAEVELRRNDVVIATGTATGADGEAGLNSDHAPGGCWDDFVPQMLPGDEVHNVTNGDFIVLGDVEITSPIAEENGAVVFRGRFAGPLPDGHGLDATIDPATEGFRWAEGSSGGQFLSAGAGDSGGSITENSDGTFTARWTGLSGVEKEQALGGTPGANVGMEHDVGPTGGEVTAFHFGETAGGFGGCTEPYRPNAVSSAAVTAVNAANAAGGLVLNGKADPNVESVSVTLSDGTNTTPAQTATPSGGTYTVTVPADRLAALRDGKLTASSNYTNADGTFPGAKFTIEKDTVAPGAPSSNIASGTFDAPVDVALNGEGVRYTTDGSDPTLGSTRYSGPVRIASTATLKAIATDAAGNTSPVSQYDITIATPVAVAPIASVTPVAPSVQPVRLRLESLTVARLMRLSSARRRGIRALIFAPSGAKAVRVRLKRGNRTIATLTRRVTGDGVLEVILPRTRSQRRALRRGTYRLQITPGSSLTKLDGVTSQRTLRLR